VEPRPRDERDSQLEREQLAEEYRWLGRELGRETDAVLAGLIEELRVRLAERIRDGREG
jgi:hypothetical protein